RRRLRSALSPYTTLFRSSAALCLAGIPFGGPVGAVRVGMVEGKLIANPTTAEQVLSSLELVIAGTEDAVKRRQHLLGSRGIGDRSEEHTSELQSRSDLVC